MVEEITLRKVRTSEELSLDMVSAPGFLLKSVDWGTIKSTHHTYRYVNQVGATVTGTSLETRDITIEGWIVATGETTMSMYKRVLNKFVNPQDAVDLLYKDYMIRFLPDETVKYSVNYEENNEIICKFQILGTCPHPMFSDSSEQRSTFAATTAHFHFPLVVSADLPEGGVVFGKRTESLIASVVNVGAVSVGMRIVFKAHGRVENPKLINVNTQERLMINKTLVADEEIVINTNVGEKSVRGRVGNAMFTNYYMYRDLDSTWLQLNTDENLFRYDADEGLDNLEVFVYFYNRFLEVQECS